MKNSTDRISTKSKHSYPCMNSMLSNDVRNRSTCMFVWRSSLLLLLLFVRAQIQYNDGLRLFSQHMYLTVIMNVSGTKKKTERNWLLNTLIVICFSRTSTIFGGAYRIQSIEEEHNLIDEYIMKSDSNWSESSSIRRQEHFKWFNDVFCHAE
jgi:hypothetical protein